MKVSLVIRTYNEAAWIGRTIAAVRQQRGAVSGEAVQIVVVDSGSTDATVRIARRLGARVIGIRQEDFSYHHATNLGVERCEGEWVAMLSAHAVPADPWWLDRMVRHVGQTDVAGVYGRQVAWPSAPLYERLRTERMFPPRPMDFGSAPSGDLDRLRFSSVSACIRRSVWQRHPFPPLATAEDRAWAREVCAAGHRIVYEPESLVWHSHRESCRQAARRSLIFQQAEDMRLGTHPTWSRTLRRAAGVIVRSTREALSPGGYPMGVRIDAVLRGVGQALWLLVESRYDEPR